MPDERSLLDVVERGPSGGTLFRLVDDKRTHLSIVLTVVGRVDGLAIGVESIGSVITVEGVVVRLRLGCPERNAANVPAAPRSREGFTGAAIDWQVADVVIRLIERAPIGAIPMEVGFVVGLARLFLSPAIRRRTVIGHRIAGQNIVAPVDESGLVGAAFFRNWRRRRLHDNVRPITADDRKIQSDLAAVLQRDVRPVLGPQEQATDFVRLTAQNLLEISDCVRMVDQASVVTREHAIETIVLDDQDLTRRSVGGLDQGLDILRRESENLEGFATGRDSRNPRFEGGRGAGVLPKEVRRGGGR